MMRYLLAFVVVASFVTFPPTVPNKVVAQESSVASITSEADLIALLKSDAPEADKALACKRLAIYGSAAAAPELVKLLDNERLASWARIAMEAIPGQEIDEALRSSVPNLAGLRLVGVLHSIGVRRDRQAVDVLASQLDANDPQVAAAAAISLGNIGTPDAASKLRSALAKASQDAMRSSIAEGCVLCAEHLLAAGNGELATEVYDEVRQAKVSKQRIVEATRGAILARKQAGIPLLIEQLKSSDKALLNIGLAVAREFPGKEVADAMVAELEKVSPDRAALIVQALADRKGTLDLPTMLQIASRGQRDVRIAAMSALSRVGDVSCVDALLKIALEKDADLLQPAKATLAGIPDEKVDQEIIKRLPSANGEMQQLLIEVIGQRRIEATQELLKALESSSKTIRSAALESLGNTVPQKQLSILIQQALSPKNADDADAARQALQTAAIRMPDRDACAAELTAAMKNGSAATKTTLLEVIGAVGGSTALQTMAAAAKDNDVQLRDVSTRLLGDWMTIDAAPVLLDLAKSGPLDKYQVRAMRGYIRIARQFVMSEKDRVAMCEKAWDAAKQSAEQKLIVEVLERYPSLGSLKLAIKAMETPDIKPEATKAAKAIAAKLGNLDEARELMKKAGLAP